jgi:phosphoribosylglycinamide formyltransferase-1
MAEALQQPIVILISGSGSNMVALVDAARDQGWRERFGAQVVGVISNRADAAGLRKAQDMGLPTRVIAHHDYPSRDHFDAALQAQIEAWGQGAARAPLVLLAGFMRVLTADFVAHHTGRLLNVHPSLLPAFTGLHTHQRALDMGCRFAGATVHAVTAELDHGDILAQAVVPILPGDDASALAARVLSQEHRIYPHAVAAWLRANAALRPEVNAAA